MAVGGNEYAIEFVIGHGEQQFVECFREGIIFGSPFVVNHLPFSQIGFVGSLAFFRQEVDSFGICFNDATPIVGDSLLVCSLFFFGHVVVRLGLLGIFAGPFGQHDAFGVEEVVAGEAVSPFTISTFGEDDGLVNETGVVGDLTYDGLAVGADSDSGDVLRSTAGEVNSGVRQNVVFAKTVGGCFPVAGEDHDVFGVD